MKISSVRNRDYNQSFNGALNNRALLYGLEKISEHGTTFVAATTLLSATLLRPAAISLTPKVDKENKQYAQVNSICSGVTKFLMVEALALPIENAVKNIDKNPDKFLKQETIETLKTKGKELAQSKDYKFATQLLKLGTGLVTAIPKSMITIALIPLIMDKVLKIKKDEPQKEQKQNLIADNNPNPVFNDMKKISFGAGFSDTASKGVAKIIDAKPFQNYVKTHSVNDTNIARNISMATDLLLTGAFVVRTKKSKKIKEERKNPLIYNNLISTGASLVFGYGIDKFIQKNTKNFIDKFKEANKNNPKLPKYIEGINILRPTIIFAAIYYGILPVVSTFLADKIDKFQSQSQN